MHDGTNHNGLGDAQPEAHNESCCRATGLMAVLAGFTHTHCLLLEVLLNKVRCQDMFPVELTYGSGVVNKRGNDRRNIRLTSSGSTILLHSDASMYEKFFFTVG